MDLRVRWKTAAGKKKSKSVRERERGREEQVLCTGQRDEGAVRKRRKLL